MTSPPVTQEERACARRLLRNAVLKIGLFLVVGAIGIFSITFLKFPTADSLRSTKDLATPAPLPLYHVGFDTLEDLDDWIVHHFRKGANIQLKLNEEGEVVADIQSRGDATLFLKEARLEITDRPKLQWEWRVDQFPSGKKNKTFGDKSESDYGARVYVVFEGLTHATSETIQYIWDDYFPVGTRAHILFFPHIKMLVIRSGVVDGWVSEKRDVYADYEMLFGKTPKKRIRAIGMMSDSDHTDTFTHAQYKNLSVDV